jgi:hypothetical protein
MKVHGWIYGVALLTAALVLFFLGHIAIVSHPNKPLGAIIAEIVYEGWRWSPPPQTEQDRETAIAEGERAPTPTNSETRPATSDATASPSNSGPDARTESFTLEMTIDDDSACPPNVIDGETACKKKLAESATSATLSGRCQVTQPDGGVREYVLENILPYQRRAFTGYLVSCVITRSELMVDEIVKLYRQNGSVAYEAPLDDIAGAAVTVAAIHRPDQRAPQAMPADTRAEATEGVGPENVPNDTHSLAYRETFMLVVQETILRPGDERPNIVGKCSVILDDGSTQEIQINVAPPYWQTSNNQTAFLHKLVGKKVSCFLSKDDQQNARVLLYRANDSVADESGVIMREIDVIMVSAAAR